MIKYVESKSSFELFVQVDQTIVDSSSEFSEEVSAVEEEEGDTSAKMEEKMTLRSTNISTENEMKDLTLTSSSTPSSLDIKINSPKTSDCLYLTVHC